VILLSAGLEDGRSHVYLDKFAVLDEAQGEGLGRAVWQVMREETPQLFWRSRHGNIVNHFYYSESDGCCKLPNFKAFWYGIDDFGEIEACVDYCRAKVPTLIDRAVSAAKKEAA
jgi:acetylglutamate kinase